MLAVKHHDNSMRNERSRYVASILAAECGWVAGVLGSCRYVNINWGSHHKREVMHSLFAPEDQNSQDSTER